MLKPWGFRGELKVQILTDFPERFASLRNVFLGDDAKPFSVERARRHGLALLLKLQGVDSPEQAAKLRDQDIQVPTEEAVPLPEGRLYLYQLIGLSVRTTAGEPLGRVSDVLATGANDVYVVNDGTHEILLPAIPPVIKHIDLETREMIVELLEGLI